MEGSFGDKVSINDEEVKLPEKGLMISDVSLKDPNDKGNGHGQEIYKKALDQYGTLYSAHPISEDALRVQDALEKKGLVKIENITLPDGTEVRKITKPESTSGTVVSEPLKEDTESKNVEAEKNISDLEKQHREDLHQANVNNLGELKVDLLGDEETTKNKIDKWGNDNNKTASEVGKVYRAHERIRATIDALNQLIHCK